LIFYDNALNPLCEGLSREIVRRSPERPIRGVIALFTQKDSKSSVNQGRETKNLKNRTLARQDFQRICPFIVRIVARPLLQPPVNDVLCGVLGDILGGNTGELGIPDPPEAWQELEQVISGDGLGDGLGQPSGESQRLDNFNANPVVLQQSLANASDRESARSMATSVLGTEGQAAMKQEMDAAEQALSAIADKSQEAQSLDVTQDVMKNLTDMVSHQSQLESGSYEQLMQLQQQSATSNLIGANISEALDEGNRAKHAEAMAGAQQMVRAAANVYLPVSIK